MKSYLFMNFSSRKKNLMQWVIVGLIVSFLCTTILITSLYLLLHHLILSLQEEGLLFLTASPYTRALPVHAPVTLGKSSCNGCHCSLFTSCFVSSAILTRQREEESCLASARALQWQRPNIRTHQIQILAAYFMDLNLFLQCDHLWF